MSKAKVAVIGMSECNLDRREHLLNKQAERREKDKKLLSEKWRNELRGIRDELNAAGL